MLRSFWINYKLISDWLIRLLATTSADHSVKIWQTLTFELISTLTIPITAGSSETPHGWMWDCQFSGDSQHLITGIDSSSY